MASFAFQLALKKIGKTIRAYKTGENSRVGLIADPIFKAAFVNAKERIWAMEYRYVEDIDQNRQALLENVLRCRSRDAVQRL